MTLEQNILGAIDGLFSLDRVTDQDKVNIRLVQEEIKKLSVDRKQQLAEYLLQNGLPPDNQLPLLFFLFDCFEDIRFLEAIIPLIPLHPSPSWFYELNYNLSQRSFSRSISSQKIQEVLRDRFYRIAATTRQFLESRSLVRKQYCFDKPRKIAILVPQLLDLRHAPTREAFNIALHLDQIHGCETFIININGMNYKNCDQLNLLAAAHFHVNEDLKGLQQVPIKYMQFEGMVNTLSFDAGPMTSQKLANIISSLQHLEIEAVIAHGENLLVMECLYGFYPSLFATTGQVVPFNHCDSYFIPGNLFTDSAKSEANKYGHSNFMLESMLVTPEGLASEPFSRQVLELNQDEFLFLVVGTRLDGELKPEFAEVCERLLQENHQAKILFAGTPGLDLNILFNETHVQNKRVLNIGFQQNLSAISAMCDVYLNPNRMGGGTSSQTAILNGLPVVTLNEGHISAVVPASRRQVDWEAYFGYANQLQQDREYLSSEAQLFKNHFYQNLDTSAQIARMYEKLVEVSANFE